MSGILQTVFQNLRSFTSAPVNTAVPTISGTTSIGQVLTSTTGTWTGSPTPTYTYQWQRGTTNIGSATSSTYTIVDADAGSTLRCRVTATNSAGSATANSANTAAVSLPAVGASFGGGYFAGQISTAGNGVANFNLVVGPVASAQNTSKQWKTSNTSTTGTSSLIDGPTNSSNMNNADHPAAQFCEGLTIGGFSDWYMPAFNELEICYYNLKPTTDTNSTSTGVNVNAVPTRNSNYTTGTPAQTSSSAFKDTGAEYFDSARYWASTERTFNTGWQRIFADGYEIFQTKTNYQRVRAVRRLAI